MKFATMSVVVGTKACDAGCGFCISEQTGYDDVPPVKVFNQTRLNLASKLAMQSNVTTVLITGKGEPTLYPGHLRDLVLERSSGATFAEIPMVEIQTNAIALGNFYLGRKSPLDRCDVGVLTNLVDTVAISVVGVRQEWNQEIYLGHRPKAEYPDLELTVRKLREAGKTVRLCVMMLRGKTDSPKKIQEALDWARANDVGQVTFRPIRRPALAIAEGGSKAAAFVAEHGIHRKQHQEIRGWVANNCTPLLDLPHGARVYDYQGQNLCLTDCLTHSTDPDDQRQLIVYPNGKITYSWDKQGAVILQGQP